METLLVFLAIAAIQMIAAYSKQKKEAEKKAARKPAPREYMGLPPIEEEAREEPFAPDRLPFESVAERKLKAEAQPQSAESLNQVSPLKRKNALAKIIDVNRPEQGIIWNMILQEPRYRAKWKPGRR